MERKGFFKLIHAGFLATPVVALLGPRQCGKTTLARQFLAQHPVEENQGVHFFDLEDPLHLIQLQNPRLA